MVPKVAGAIRFLVNAGNLQLECEDDALDIPNTCSFVW